MQSEAEWYNLAFQAMMHQVEEGLREDNVPRLRTAGPSQVSEGEEWVKVRNGSGTRRRGGAMRRCPSTGLFASVYSITIIRQDVIQVTVEGFTEGVPWFDVIVQSTRGNA
jgi:hypothetical protein